MLKKIPNILTIGRIIIVPFFVLAFYLPGFYGDLTALILFGLTIFINIFIHNFWSLLGDPSQAHEIQNFIKNLAIAAGLLILATKDKN